jgi:hypothetical protein
VSIVSTWSPGQRALLRFLEREGLVRDVPPPPSDDTPAGSAELLAAVAATVPASVVAELLSARLHLPLFDADDVVDPAAAEAVDAAIAARCGAVPIALHGSTLDVAMANPLDLDAVKTIEFATGRRVRVRVATPLTVQRVLARLYGAESADGPSTDTPAAEDSLDSSPPASAEQSASTGPAEDAAPPAPQSGAPATPRILVVADGACERERLGGALSAASDWLVMTARNAAEASLLLSLTAPHLVVTAAAAHEEVRGALSSGTCLVADAGDTADLVARVKTMIDTAIRG